MAATMTTVLGDQEIIYVLRDDESGQSEMVIPGEVPPQLV